MIHQNSGKERCPLTPQLNQSKVRHLRTGEPLSWATLQWSSPTPLTVARNDPLENQNPKLVIRDAQPLLLARQQKTTVPTSRKQIVNAGVEVGETARLQTDARASPSKPSLMTPQLPSTKRN